MPAKAKIENVIALEKSLWMICFKVIWSHKDKSVFHGSLADVLKGLRSAYIALIAYSIALQLHERVILRGLRSLEATASGMFQSLRKPEQYDCIGICSRSLLPLIVRFYTAGAHVLSGGVACPSSCRCRHCFRRRWYWVPVLAEVYSRGGRGIDLLVWTNRLVLSDFRWRLIVELGERLVVAVEK